MKRKFLAGLVAGSMFVSASAPLYAQNADTENWNSGINATALRDFQPIPFTEGNFVEPATIAAGIATALSIIASLKSIFAGNASEEQLAKTLAEINAKLDSLIAGQSAILVELKGLRAGIRADMRVAFLFDLESHIKGHVFDFEQTSNRFGDADRRERKRMVKSLVLLESAVRHQANTIYQYGTGGYMGSVVAFGLLLEIHNLTQKLGSNRVRRELLRKEEAFLVRTTSEWGSFIAPEGKDNFYTAKVSLQTDVANLKSWAEGTRSASPHVINTGKIETYRGRCLYRRSYRDLLYISGGFDAGYHDRTVRDFGPWHRGHCDRDPVDGDEVTEKAESEPHDFTGELEANTPHMIYSPQKMAGERSFLVHGITASLNAARAKAVEFGKNIVQLDALMANVATFIEEAKKRKDQVTSDLGG